MTTPGGRGPDYDRGQRDLTNAANAIIAHNLTARDDAGGGIGCFVGLAIALLVLLVVVSPAVRLPVPNMDSSMSAPAPTGRDERITLTRTALWPQPTATGRPIATLDAGWRVTVLAPGATMHRVEHGGRVGYVSAKDLIPARKETL